MQMNASVLVFLSIAFSMVESFWAPGLVLAAEATRGRYAASKWMAKKEWQPPVEKVEGDEGNGVSSR